MHILAPRDFKKQKCHLGNNCNFSHMNTWQQNQQQNNQGQTPPHTPRQRGNGNKGSMMSLVDASTEKVPAPPPSFGSFTIELKVPGQD